jgi:thioredoxin
VKRRRRNVNEPVRLDNAVFRREVLEADIPVLVEFTAPWCAPCGHVGRIVSSIAREYTGLLKVAQIDTDHNQDIASQFDIQGLPTLLLFYHGEELGRTGEDSEHEVKEWLEAHLPRA